MCTRQLSGMSRWFFLLPSLEGADIRIESIVSGPERIMKEILAIAGAGALGALGRHAVNTWAVGTFPGGFYYGTFFVNVVGCFLLGLLMAVAAESGFPPREIRLALGVGFLGSFTTFSTFGYETVNAFERGLPGVALVIVASNIVVGLTAAWGGMYLGRMIAEGL